LKAIPDNPKDRDIAAEAARRGRFATDPLALKKIAFGKKMTLALSANS
jgi:hypothetical protein